MKTRRGYYDMLVQSCARHHDRVAVRQVEGERCHTYTYSEIFGVCEYISQNLQLLRCRSGIIGIVTQRNPLVPAVIAAVHKNSPTFMFMDPQNDNNSVMKNVKFQAVITLHTKDRYFDFINKEPDRVICIYNIIIKFYKMLPVVENHNSNIDDRSFIMSTSGSTGEPKQVQVPVQCIQPNIDDLRKMFNMSCCDVVYFSTPLTFDPSMVELLLAVTSGASLLIAPSSCDTIYQPSEHAVTVWQTTPSLFFQLRDENIRAILSHFSNLRILAFGGEPFNYVKQLKQSKDKWNKTQIFCLYGVTELSCWACATELHIDSMDDREIPLGKCLSETLLQVDVQEKDGTIGNIQLGSATRKCSLLNMSVNSAQSNKNWIDTGDLGEIKNGTVYYRGRTDDVVKRFGHRIYLQMIERTVLTCSKVKTCSCVWLPTPHIMILFYTSDSMPSHEMGSFLNETLDDKNRPDRIVRIKSMPLNRHGKICKSELLARQTPQVKPEPPKDVKAILMKELRFFLKHRFTYNEIKDKDFFAVGGTSFLAVALCNKLNAMYSLYNFSILSSLLTPNMTFEHIFNSLDASNHQQLKIIKKRIASSKKIVEKKPIKMDASSTIAPMRHLKSIKILQHWTFDTKKCVDAMPTVYQSASKTYVTAGSHSGNLVVLDTETGNVFGELNVRARIEAPVYCYEDKNNKPHGVVGTYDGTLVCFSLDDCSVAWKVNIQSMVKSKATMANDSLYVASYDGNLRCFNYMTGEIKQVITISKHSISADLACAGDATVMVCTLGGECGIVNAESNTITWSNKVGSPIFSAPILYDNDKMIFAEVNKIVHCLSLFSGAPIWCYDGALGNIFSSISLKKNGSDLDVLFGCHDSNLYCLNVQENKVRLKWKTQTKSEIFSTPCYISDHLILAASIKGILYIIETEKGAIVHEYGLPGEIFSSPNILGNQIFIGCRDNLLYSLKCIPKA